MNTFEKKHIFRLIKQHNRQNAMQQMIYLRRNINRIAGEKKRNIFLGSLLLTLCISLSIFAIYVSNPNLSFCFYNHRFLYTKDIRSIMRIDAFFRKKNVDTDKQRVIYREMTYRSGINRWD